MELRPRSPRKACIALAATLYAIYYVRTVTGWHFIDNVDLLIHEAGHWIFRPFGEFIYFLMGSGFQILFPAVFAGYFAWKRQWYSAGLTSFWVGLNIMNVAVYAGDAERMQIDLIGGEHDWNWIFTYLNVLRHTDAIASVIYSAGILALALAALLSLAAAWVDAE